MQPKHKVLSLSLSHTHMHAHTHKKAINYSYKVSAVIPMQVNMTRDPIRMQEQNQELP